MDKYQKIFLAFWVVNLLIILLFALSARGHHTDRGQTSMSSSDASVKLELNEFDKFAPRTAASKIAFAKT